MPSEIAQDGESVPIPKDLQYSYDIAKAVSNNHGDPNCKFIVKLIERVWRAEAALREMTIDRNLWQEAHDEDCPNKIALEAAEAALSSGHTRGWISVEERLPDKGSCLAWRGTVVMMPYYERGQFWNDDPDGKGSDVPFVGVTHWMPLPDPPRKPDTQQGGVK